MGKASRLWRLAKALNDEDPKKSKITLEEDGKLLTGKGQQIYLPKDTVWEAITSSQGRERKK